MSRQPYRSRQLTVLVVGGLLLLAVPAGLALAEGLTAHSTATEATPTVPEPLNRTDTSTPTTTSTATPTSTGTPDDTTTDAPGSEETGTSQTIVVDDDLADCPDADFQTVQAAVDATAAGTSVRVCAGTYPESVTVATANLTIRADGDATIVSGVDEGFNVTASRVTIDGFALQTTEGAGIRVAADGVVVRDSTVESSQNGNNTADDDGIKLVSTNESVVRNNTVSGFPDDGISLGEEMNRTRSTHGFHPPRNVSTHNVIRSNTVTGPDPARAGIAIGSYADRTVVRTNTVTDISAAPNYQKSSRHKRYGSGIRVRGDHTKLIGNTIERVGYEGIRMRGGSHTIRGNTVNVCSVSGIEIATRVNWTVSGNTVKNCPLGFELWGDDGRRRLVNNTIIGNNVGVQISPGVRNRTLIEIHRNRFRDNKRLAINNQNRDKTDDEWPIVDATNNYWGCGGPSGGLEDPETGRAANGTGGVISAGDDPGVSNVRFDPFLERSSCPEQTSTPTDTPTETSTATPTPTPPPAGDGTGTHSGTVTGSGDGGDGESGDGDGDGSGDGGGADNDASSGGDERDGADGETATTPPTPTSSPTATPTATVSPTPTVEPGFGVLTGLVGVALLVGLLTVRRRSDVGSEESHD